MKWFDRWFYRKVRWCLNRAESDLPLIKDEQDFLDRRHRARDNSNIAAPRENPIDSSGGVNMEHGIRFNVLNCRGGIVLEVRIWDSKMHEHRTKTYLIPDGEPVAERIGHYVTMEMMNN